LVKTQNRVHLYKTHLGRGKIYGRTRTDRSKGVRGSEALLRTCGAQIRSMFIRAGAARLAVPESELLAKNGAIVHATTSGRQLATVPDPASVTLKAVVRLAAIGPTARGGGHPAPAADELGCQEHYAKAAQKRDSKREARMPLRLGILACVSLND
jgi:CO/xanthine dehydrogenase Mo-binding subunit